MNEEEMHEMAFAYAIHALDDDDRQTFEAHLAECPACQRDVAQTQDAVAGLSEDLAVEPPPHLRSVVLDRVAAEASTVTPLAPRRDGRASSETRRREHRPGRWLAAAAAAVVLAGGVWGVARTLDPDPTSQVLQAADAAEHTADTEDGPVAVVVSDAAGQAVVQLPGNFAAPQSGQVYQAWFVGPDGAARSAGLLTAETVAEGRSLLEGSPDGAVAVGLTVEPAGGSTQPTTEPFVVVPLA